MSYPPEFERTEMLFGEGTAERLSRCHVAVFGLGGVGGHAVEALARSSVGELTLVDADRVSESNLNRQLFATRHTVGMLKTDAAEERIREITPGCRIHKRAQFVLPENLGEYDFTKYDYVIDAIDTVSAKLAIIKACSAVGTPVISAMGAGNKVDPTKFEVADIYETSTCPLAAVIRRELRKAGVPGLKVVYSKEEARTPAFQPKPDPDADPAQPGSHRRATPASCAFVPSVSGLILAGEVVKELVKGER